VRGLARAGVTIAGETGPFGAADMQRLVTAASFLEGGFTLDQLASAIADRALSFEFADAFQLEPTERTGRTMAEFAAAIGEPIERLREVYGAFGLPLPDPTTPTGVVEEELVTAFLRAWRIASDADATTRAARIVGDSARRAAEGWIELYVEQVSRPHLAREDTYEAYAKATIEPAAHLVELAPRLLVWLQQRHSTKAMRAVNLELFEEDLVARQVIPERPPDLPLIAFVDLVGYTRMTEAQGDARAVYAAARLQALAEAAANRHDGRVVKLLGDGALLRFGNPGSAAAALLALADEVPAAGLGPAHIGLERGPVVERDGDVFGRTVNLAARLSGAASGGQVLLGPAASDAIVDDHRYAVVDVGTRELKGFASPIRVHQLQPAEGR
jgi:adenylate cyclase